MYLNSLKILVASLLIAGCTEREIVTVEADTVVIQPPRPSPIRTKPVEFKVINEKTIDSIDIANTSWYSLNALNYENLAYNMQEILRYLRQQNSVIQYYRNITVQETQIE